MGAQTQRYVQLAIGWREATIIFSINSLTALHSAFKTPKENRNLQNFSPYKSIYLLHYVSPNFIKLGSTSIVYPGVDLHGQEQPEVGVGGQAVELLLQGHQPVGGQVDILQHDPAT